MCTFCGICLCICTVNLNRKVSVCTGPNRTTCYNIIVAVFRNIYSCSLCSTVVVTNEVAGFVIRDCPSFVRRFPITVSHITATQRGVGYVTCPAVAVIYSFVCYQRTCSNCSIGQISSSKGISQSREGTFNTVKYGNNLHIIFCFSLQAGNSNCIASCIFKQFIFYIYIICNFARSQCTQKCRIPGQIQRRNGSTDFGKSCTCAKICFIGICCRKGCECTGCSSTYVTYHVHCFNGIGVFSICKQTLKGNFFINRCFSFFIAGALNCYSVSINIIIAVCFGNAVPAQSSFNKIYFSRSTCNSCRSSVVQQACCTERILERVYRCGRTLRNSSHQAMNLSPVITSCGRKHQCIKTCTGTILHFNVNLMNTGF